ncbi:MAG: competence/damage-inducible protein A [Desulfosalsimonadaceae bacterium]
MNTAHGPDHALLLAQVVSTGDEVVTGAIVDTNSAFIAARLLELGLHVTRHTAVGDDALRLRKLLVEIGDHADIAIVTGGLGPTVDDITARAAADAAGVALVENAAALASIQAFFERFSRSMSPSDHKQALFPENAEILFNRSGTAPGFAMAIGKCRFFFLPGVPREMQTMMAELVIPAIRADYIPPDRQQHYREKQLSLFGLPEAEVNQRLIEPAKLFKGVKLGMLARFPVIIVKLFAFGRDSDKIGSRIEEAAGRVHEALGRWIFSDNGEALETVVARLLTGKGLTVAVAESCTGGLISDHLTNVSGSSDYFLLSAVTYANEAKTAILGVSPDTIEAYGAVSEQTAGEMAAGIRRISGADYGVATSGIAGPTGGTDDKPVGTLCVAIAGPQGVISKRRLLPFRDRAANKEIFAYVALDMLRRELIA